MALLRTVIIPLLILILFPFSAIIAQPCTTLGQTPSTAFPVCGTSTFTQSTVPLCNTNNLYVPGCSGTGSAGYANKNPFFYKFTCYTAGTLGFIINPLAQNEDYDWQLWDITGRNPEDIFTDTSLIVTGNWAGTYGATGASGNGVNFIQCGSDPNDNRPTFARMPQLILGHEYLLMVSHFTDGQSGYTLNFGGGTAVITDPTDPHLMSAKPDCDGLTIRVKLNKKMRCNSLTTTGSEFSLLPAVTTVASAVTTTCSSAFDFDEVTITLASALPNGNYQLVIGNGTDGNSLLDNCNRAIPAEQAAFFYAIPQPIFADSIGTPKCAPDSVRIYFPKRVACNSIAPNGSDFTVVGPSPVTVISAAGNCINGLSDYITVKFASPIYTQGNYTLTLRAGTDGSTVIDECNIPMPQHSLPFNTVDTVSANFSYLAQLGCRQNTLVFSHDGANGVNKWNWTFNDSVHVTTQTHTIIFPATSTNTAELIVTNGICSDSSQQTIMMDNEVIAGIDMPDVICPEDLFIAKDTSAGLIDNWQWSFGNIASSTLQNPPPVQFPQNNIESYYIIKLRVTNNTLGCTDSISKQLRVLNNCFIAVPSAFTPNGDGLNDFLYPNNALKAKDLEFKVYNRWGQLVFSTRNWQEKWNGKINGIPQAPGVFVWFLKYTHISTGQPVFQKGTTTLIR
ncbi:MAG: gliding motility-associated C-terminal domain-containing protein [Chitinophagaceae bacterium]|nr:gliding motility-associated C-terminal domain-containing protein [Chitinophagaceae bacterium]